MATNIFKIPKAYEESFQIFFNLDNSLRSELIKKLGEATIELSNKKNIQKISEILDISFAQLISIDQMIFSLFSLIDDRNLPITEIADGLIEACASNDKLKINQDDLPIIRDHLIQLLSLHNQPYGLSAKAMELSNDYNNILVETKIITDIRPVFKNDNVESPASTLILHNLKLTYYNEKTEKEIYITLDSDDIDKLIEVLNRAKQKELSLKKYLNNKDIKFLEFDNE